MAVWALVVASPRSVWPCEAPFKKAKKTGFLRPCCVAFLQVIFCLPTNAPNQTIRLCISFHEFTYLGGPSLKWRPRNMINIFVRINSIRVLYVDAIIDLPAAKGFAPIPVDLLLSAIRHWIFFITIKTNILTGSPLWSK